jgi:cyclin C
MIEDTIHLFYNSTCFTNDLSFCAVIQQLGETLKLRQQVVATATVFLKRFYARYSLKCIDPLLLAPTAVFLASKVEECGVISNNRLISTCQQVG